MVKVGRTSMASTESVTARLNNGACGSKKLSTANWAQWRREKAKSNNDMIKNLIKDIKDDDAGVKYIYLTPVPGKEAGSETELGDAGAPQAPAEKIVGSMAKSALASRS